MKSVETSEGCGRQGRRRERVKAQQDNSQVPLSKEQATQVLYLCTKIPLSKDQVARVLYLCNKLPLSKDPGRQVPFTI